MRYKKRLSLVLSLVLCISIFLIGCAENSKLSSGTYTADDGSGSLISPAVYFDFSENLFTFGYDPFSSYLSAGRIEIEDDLITATTDDDLYTYKFKIEDDHTVSYVQDGSEEIKTVEGEHPVKDGTKFVFTE